MKLILNSQLPEMGRSIQAVFGRKFGGYCVACIMQVKLSGIKHTQKLVIVFHYEALKYN